jgi:hypothetical protein
MKTWSTKPTHDYDAPNSGTTLVGYETVIPARQKVKSVALLIPQKRKPEQFGIQALWKRGHNSTDIKNHEIALF